MLTVKTAETKTAKAVKLRPNLALKDSLLII